MKFPDARILVFAKAPIPGQCKTRLIPTLGAIAAAELHQQLVLRTLETATKAELCPVELWCTPSQQHPFFSDCQQRYPLSLQTQSGASLGERMANAIATTLTRSRPVVLIGSDCPALTATTLTTALSQLASGIPAILGPAEDGGYVLLGLNQMIGTLFEDIPWGSDKVLSLTRQRLAAEHISWHELDTLWDLDRPADLSRYYDGGAGTLT